MLGPNLLLLLLLISCNSVVVLFLQVDAAVECGNDANNNNNNMGALFEMYHRHSPKLKSHSKFLGPPKCRQDAIAQLLHSDIARRQMISTSHVHGRSRRKAFDARQRPTAAQLPMYSGSDAGQGQYFVNIGIGSPPQNFTLIADTGSDLTWLNCEYRCRHCPEPNPYPSKIFHAKNSSSFRPIPCSSGYCKTELQQYFSLTKCPAPNAPCLFDYRYISGQRALGVFANETVTVGIKRKVRVSNALIGCTASFNQTDGFPDGVMGLGLRDHSLGLRLADTFGRMFSYCLVDHLSSSNDQNFLSFGDVPETTKATKMQHTELLLGYLDAFYTVNVSDISVGGKMLNTSLEIWNVTGSGGMILDSGTSLMVLAGEAYDKVVKALEPTFAKYEKAMPLDLPGLDEHCFDDKGYNNATVPRLAIHFADGAVFEPPVKSYIIDVADGIKCLGVLKADFPGLSVLGNIMQQNHFWEFDLGRGLLGFGPSSCLIGKSN